MAKKQDTAIVPAGQAPIAPGGKAPLARLTTLEYAFVDLVSGEAARDFSEAIAANMGGATVSAFDFQRIKVPAGGGKVWETIDPDTGEVAAEATIEGVIVGFKDQKAYWKRGLDEQGAVQGPPDCFSSDTVRGVGDPGILCAKCQFNKFGTAKGGQGRGKACKDVRLLFVMRPGDVLPVLIPIPPTSLKNVKTYFMMLSSRAVPYWRAISKFKLVGDKNAAGISYAKVLPSAGAILDGAAAGAAAAYADNLKRWLGSNTVPIRPEDVADPSEGQGTADMGPGAQRTADQEGPEEGEEVTEGEEAGGETGGNRADEI